MPFLSASDYRKTPSAQFIAEMSGVSHYVVYEFDRTAAGAIKDMLPRAMAYYHPDTNAFLGRINYRTPGSLATVERRY